MLIRSFKNNGRCHGVRNVQQEYVATEGTNVETHEAFCGRKCSHESCSESPEVTCKGCLKGIAKAKRRI